MKKTLIALACAAMVGTASAADSLEPVKWISWENGQQEGYWTGWNSTFKYTTGASYATFGNGTKPWMNGLDIDGSFTLDMTFKHDITNFVINTNGTAAWKTFLSFSTKNSETVQFQINGQRGLNIYTTPVIGGNNTITNFKFDQFVDFSTLTIVSDAESNQLSLYINNVLLQTIKGWAVDSINGIQFGDLWGSSDGSRTLNGEILVSGMNLYNGIALPVPEPTTATLSLLALAGLCARRRRK